MPRALLVVYLRRTGGQSQYSALLAAHSEADVDRFAVLERWIAENLTEDLRVERLAERAGMSARNFARRYAGVRFISLLTAARPNSLASYANIRQRLMRSPGERFTHSLALNRYSIPVSPWSAS